MEKVRVRLSHEVHEALERQATDRGLGIHEYLEALAGLRDMPGLTPAAEDLARRVAALEARVEALGRGLKPEAEPVKPVEAPKLKEPPSEDDFGDLDALLGD
jgi:hypothetical protein